MADQFNILDYTAGPLLKTGQTTNFTPAGRTSQDDGGLQRGIIGSFQNNQYVILTTGQYSGTTAITVNAIVDNHSNNCVFDKVTGLMWSRDKTPVIYGGGAQALLWDNTAGANEDIFNYCDQANINNLSGYNDWRLPNLNEILSLCLKTGGANLVAFPLLTTVSVWSSTTNPTATTQAWYVTFTDGRPNSGVKTTTRVNGMLVRLGIKSS